MFSVFEVYKWSGKPKQAEKGITDIKWFDINDLPYDKMHKKSKNWFPNFLEK